MNILVLGSGGREHTLAWKIHQSKHTSQLFVAPGNAGTTFATNVNIQVNEFEKIAQFVKEKSINMVIIGPEDPLVNGLRDFLHSIPELKDLMIIGPGKSGARLEGSKDFSKGFLERNKIPAAASKTFTAETYKDGVNYLKTRKLPIVLKADGLAAGKGVIIAESYDSAIESLKDMLLNKKFGKASSNVLIEDYLEGIEVSVFILTDGTSYLTLPEAKDYKRIGEKDEGPNTGGMGAVSPVPFADPIFMQKVEDRIVKPTIAGLQKEGIPYSGFIFIGLMSVNNDPFVIEYNVRMGDPETQVVLPRIENDIVEVFEAAATGNLDKIQLQISKESAVTVVLASQGYPGNYEKGHFIQGLDEPNEGIIFHAGTKSAEDGIVTSGGRVMAITGKGNDLSAAIANAYQGVGKIHWTGMQYRKDIGKDVLSLLENH